MSLVLDLFCCSVISGIYAYALCTYIHIQVYINMCMCTFGKVLIFNSIKIAIKRFSAPNTFMYLCTYVGMCVTQQVLVITLARLAVP